MIRQDQIETIAGITSQTLKDLATENGNIPLPAVDESPEETAVKFRRELTSLETKISDHLTQDSSLLMFKSLLGETGE